MLDTIFFNSRSTAKVISRAIIVQDDGLVSVCDLNTVLNAFLYCVPGPFVTRQQTLAGGSVQWRLCDPAPVLQDGADPDGDTP